MSARQAKKFRKIAYRKARTDGVSIIAKMQTYVITRGLMARIKMAFNIILGKPFLRSE